VHLEAPIAVVVAAPGAPASAPSWITPKVSRFNSSFLKFFFTLSSLPL
jgi:hypothetical protein